jgi:signal transduction histidine kinase
MDLSKIEAGQMHLHKTTFSVIRLIKDLQKQYSFVANEKGLDFRISVDESIETLNLESDENRLRQILVNFVSNAIKFTGDGYVELGAKVIKKEVLFYVEDSGIGIPHEFHDKIFERFSQVETSLSRKFGGNGLGLAISKSLAELLGGKIGMSSEYKKGSIFHFTVPVTG